VALKCSGIGVQVLWNHCSRAFRNDCSSAPESVFKWSRNTQIITPPEVSAQIVEDALALGIRFLWFQPGAEHRGAIERARRAGCVVISDGPCLLVVLGWRER
jgi:hypothetical protein